MGDILAVVFDMDGVIIDSEQVWDRVRREYAAEHGGTWTDTATRDMQGMSAPEWSAFMAETLRVNGTPEQIDAGVVAGMQQHYAQGIPLLPGAREAVSSLAEHWPLGLASSSNRPLIDTVLATAGLAQYFTATISSEEVDAGKPEPDVYLAACQALTVPPHHAAAVEDSTGGLLSAHRAGLKVIAVPNPHYPPDGTVLIETAQVVLDSVSELDPAVVRAL